MKPQDQDITIPQLLSMRDEDILLVVDKKPSLMITLVLDLTTKLKPVEMLRLAAKHTHLVNLKEFRQLLKKLQKFLALVLTMITELSMMEEAL